MKPCWRWKVLQCEVLEVKVAGGIREHGNVHLVLENTAPQVRLFSPEATKDKCRRVVTEVTWIRV